MIPNLRRKPSGWYECACPFCGDTKAHMQISPDFRWGRCFRCDRSMPIKDILEAYNEEEGFVPKEDTKRKKKIIPIALLSKDFIPVNEVDMAMDYLYNRGVLVDALLLKWQFGMGGMFNNRIIIPVYCEQELMGYVGRTILPDEKKRYLNSPGFNGGNSFYNYDMVRGKKIVTISEGIFDTLQVAKALPQVGALGCFGKEMSEGKLKLLRMLNPEEIVILLDSEEKDSKIKSSVISMKQKLSELEVMLSVATLLKGDPAENSFEELQEAFFNRQIV